MAEPAVKQQKKVFFFFFFFSFGSLVLPLLWKTAGCFCERCVRMKRPLDMYGHQLV